MNINAKFIFDKLNLNKNGQECFENLDIFDFGHLAIYISTEYKSIDLDKLATVLADLFFAIDVEYLAEDKKLIIKFNHEEKIIIAFNANQNVHDFHVLIGKKMIEKKIEGIHVECEDTEDNFKL